MPTKLTSAEETAIEKSTYIITVSFTDEFDAAVVPKSLTWSLSDIFGNVINTRTAISITPAASVTIVLYGDDLVALSNGTLERVLTIEGTYDSIYGNNLPIKDQLTFPWVNLINVVES
jgi:hypothetical protein